MKCLCITFVLIVILVDVSIAKKKKLDLDFEFVDKIEKDVSSKSELKKKQWIHDPTNELCQPLNCKKRELCLLEDAFTAVCVSKAMLHKNRDEIISIKSKKNGESTGNNGPRFSDEIYLTDDLIGDSNIKRCKPCTTTKQSFVCGSDNRTYSSFCRLDYHNCVHNTVIKSSCKGFCPCKDIRTKTFECQPQELSSIGNRLLDWFSVIMADTKKQKRRMAKSKVHFPAACKLEVRFMLGHLDMNVDGLLSKSELYDLEHDQNERCIKPFIDTCDLDNDSILSPREWCRCFEKTDRPCAAIRRRMKSDLFDGYIPDCDIQGFYRPTQCHTKVGICWCVDKHGVEFANTRTRGRPICDDVTKNVVSQPSDDEDDDLDYDDNDEASANGPISY